MKVTEVPQDNNYLTEGKVKDYSYATDEQGNYVTVLSTGFEPTQIAMEQAWEDIIAKLSATKQKVLACKLSPIAFYMEKCLMDLNILASYMKLPKWKVRRHFKYKVYRKLSPEILMRYAEVFKISLDDFDKLEIPQIIRK